MTRPQIVVTVAAAITRRGNDSATGTAFIVYAGATGSTTPVEVLTRAEATSLAGAPATVAAYVDDALAQGAPRVVLLRAAAANVNAVTEEEWTTALDKLTDGYGPGQVLIPGISSEAAHAALLAHAHATMRCVLLDTAQAANPAAILAIAEDLADVDGSRHATLLAGWLAMPGPGGATRYVPPSVAAAGLAARGDSRVGHANHAPCGSHSGGAGYVIGALPGAAGVTLQLSAAEHDELHDAGVSCFVVKNGQAQLYGWVSLALSEAAFRQLNWGRTAMQIHHDIAQRAEAFLFRQIDSKGYLYAELEGVLRGYLQTQDAAGALYEPTSGPEAGPNASRTAYDVEVAGVNTPTTAAAGELHAAVAVSLSAHTEKVEINVITNIAEGVSA